MAHTYIAKNTGRRVVMAQFESLGFTVAVTKEKSFTTRN